MSDLNPMIPLIHDTIAEEGPITIERYMEIVLHHPQHGYYRQGNPLGAGGDFLTSPDASPLFGEMIGVWCVEAWKVLGKPSPFILLELGPGQGSLLQAALNFTQHMEGFAAAFKLYLLESNTTLRQIQNEKLSIYSPAHIDDFKNFPAWPMIVIANEFFDTLPMRQFTRSRIGWRERLVAQKGGELQFTSRYKMNLPKSISINERARKTKPGFIYEASAQARSFMEKINSHIAQNSGAGLIIDYGYIFPPENGTLDALHKHRFVDVFASPGKVDVTAGVDFSVLADIAAQKGNIVADLVTQDKFLERMGLSSRVEMLRAQADDTQKININHGLRYISSHSLMGKYKVLEFGKRRE
jgi:NADH dehydrogenase [ubiquinone] 1 alpha subcomplex assembly factor 7